MRTTTSLLVATALALAASTASANLLSNPGFEDPVTSDGPPFVGSWEAFSGDGDQVTGPDVARNSTLMPRNGLESLELGIFELDNTFAGVFQDVDGLTAGQSAIWSGWHLLIGDGGGIEIRIEWRDSVADVEISRTATLTPTPGGTYEPFSLTAMVPVGADTARVVYAIQSFGGASDQLVYVDDTSFAIVTPEPTTLGLLSLAGLMLIGFKRRAG